jgi:hypothetical protein
MSFLWWVLGLVGMFLCAAFGEMVSEEIRGRLDRLTHAVLKLAILRLDPADWETAQEYCGPDLDEKLRGDESVPITRLIRGMAFALSLAWRVRSGDAPPPDPVSVATHLSGSGSIAGTAANVSKAFADWGAGSDNIVDAKAGGATGAGTASGAMVVVHESRQRPTPGQAGEVM